MSEKNALTTYKKLFPNNDRDDSKVFIDILVDLSRIIAPIKDDIGK